MKETLNNLEKQKVTGISQWVNPLVIIGKQDNKLRICLDLIKLNKVVIREYSPIPTLEQITHKLKNAEVFSTLDATQGFYQTPLEKESSELCTFGTPFGRYKFKRLPYGIVCSRGVSNEI